MAVSGGVRWTGACPVCGGECLVHRGTGPIVRGLLKRGELWTIAGGSNFAGKPRPVLIVQDDRFDATRSVTICPLTTTAVDAPLIRVPVRATETSGLQQDSTPVIDKITTVRRSKLGQCLGRVDEQLLLQFGRSALVFLGVAG